MQKQITFSGAIQGQEIDTPPHPNTQSAYGSTTGIATHVGQLSFTYDLTVGNGKGTGSAHLIAANGDSIYTTIAGSFALTSTADVAGITEMNTITGGTGRFVGAQGSFIVKRLLNSGSGFTSGSFDGTITPRVQTD
jgi:hypothetical protein